MNILWLKTLQPNQIALNNKMFAEFYKPNTITMHFGTLKITLNVIIKNDLLDGTIGLPVNVSVKYTIPTDIPYEVHYKAGGIYFGPVIAHIVPRCFNNLNNKILSAYLPRFIEYQSIKGLIFICTKDSIKIDENLIEGYYYDPKGHISGSIWKYGKFPLPNAVYNRSFISPVKIYLLQTKIGDRIFNSYWYNLNKWNLWRRLSKDNVLIKHLPYTEKYVAPDQLKRLLEKHKSVYLKPFCQSRGRGILNVSKTAVDNQFVVIDENKRRYYFKDDKTMIGFLNKKITSLSIIQQAVPFKMEDKLLDFRIILQRDRDKEWSYKGCFAKVSKSGSIITNSQGREKVLKGREVLTNIYNLSDQAAEKIENEMINLTKKAICIYEQSGIHLGDVAADIILDSKLHLWLLELQLNHGASDNLPPEIFKEIMATPFRYAKTLAGFNS